MGVDYSQEDIAFILGTISAFKLAGWVPRQLKERTQDFLQKVSSKMDHLTDVDGMTEIHEIQKRKSRERTSVTSFTFENTSAPAVSWQISVSFGTSEELNNSRHRQMQAVNDEGKAPCH